MNRPSCVILDLSTPFADMYSLKKLVALKIGPFPLPLIGAIVVILLMASRHDQLSDDVIGGLAALMATGYILTATGSRIPVLNQLGGPAMLCVLVPSFFLGQHLIPTGALTTIQSAIDTDNVLYLYIASLVVGSILGIERKLLVRSFPRKFLPLITGTVVAIIASPLVGMLFGLNPWHSLFFIVTPILSGGLGEGILPLAIAYSEITGKSRVELSSLMIPAALIANLFAIVTASFLSQMNRRHPSLNQDATKATKSPADTPPPNPEDHTPFNIELMSAGLLVICTLYTFGRLVSPLISLPATIAMIIIVVILKLFNAIPAPLEVGAFQVYKSISKALTPAILVAFGVLYIPWDGLIDIIQPGYVAVCLTTVVSMVTSGYWVGKYLRLPPIDSATICACHSGFGGTGNVAILSAAKSQNLMPFAEIATSLGGAVMVILATVFLRMNWSSLQSLL